MKTYDFVFLGGLERSYAFETSIGIIYEIKFKQTGYLFDNNEFSHYLYEFVIDVVFNKTGRKPPLDQLVSNTIFAILTDFFYTNEKHICLYICDSSDGKQDIRRRKFEDWFNKHQDGSFTKMDQVLLDSEGNKYPISLIVKNENPHFSEILISFGSLTKNNGK